MWRLPQITHLCISRLQEGLRERPRFTKSGTLLRVHIEGAEALAIICPPQLPQLHHLDQSYCIMPSLLSCLRLTP